jgi:hypothetical protein
VLVLLDNLNHDSRRNLMFIWWKALHHINNVIFDKGDASVDNSIRFLQNNLNIVEELPSRKGNVDMKDKAPTNLVGVQKQPIDHEAKWEKEQ